MIDRNIGIDSDYIYVGSDCGINLEDVEPDNEVVLSDDDPALPDEMIMRILEYLPDLSITSLVCRQWKGMVIEIEAKRLTKMLAIESPLAHALSYVTGLPLPATPQEMPDGPVQGVVPNPQEQLVVTDLTNLAVRHMRRRSLKSGTFKNVEKLRTEFEHLLPYKQIAVIATAYLFELNNADRNTYSTVNYFSIRAWKPEMNDTRRLFAIYQDVEHRLRSPTMFYTPHDLELQTHQWLKSGGNPQVNPVHAFTKNIQGLRKYLIARPDLINGGYVGSSKGIARNGQTPLHQASMAIAKNGLARMQILIDLGADVNAQWNGDTPLHLVISKPVSKPRLLNGVTILLRAGANPHLQNCSGKTSLQHGKRSSIKRYRLFDGRKDSIP